MDTTGVTGAVLRLRNEIQSDIIGFVCSTFLVDAEEIDPEESLVDQGIVDSFGLVEISTFIKKTYGLQTEVSEINRENFGSLVKIVAYVERKAQA